MTLPTYLALALDTVPSGVYHPCTGNGACVAGVSDIPGVTNQLGERADPWGYQPARAASVSSVEGVSSAEDAALLSACLG